MVINAFQFAHFLWYNSSIYDNTKDRRNSGMSVKVLVILFKTLSTHKYNEIIESSNLQELHFLVCHIEFFFFFNFLIYKKWINLYKIYMKQLIEKSVNGKQSAKHDSCDENENNILRRAWKLILKENNDCHFTHHKSQPRFVRLKLLSQRRWHARCHNSFNSSLNASK